MFKQITILIFLCLSNFSFGQSENLKRGKIYNALPVESSTDTYALYLPNSYDESNLSAIVFIFDPSGRGDIGIRVFVEAAEKYNYILVSSNATKNGIPYEENFATANLLFDTIFKKFIINEKQIYTAGFSGGSRLASAIAALTNKIQGVIACGAGLSVNKEFEPSKEMFSFVGLVGDEDMNYLEMLNTRKWLNNYAIDNELLIYKDNHQWPPREQIDRAFGWLELQAYKRNIRTVNPSVVKELYNQQYTIADSLHKHNMLFRSIIEFESMVHNFKPYFALDSIIEKIESTKASNTYKEVISNREKIVNKENEIFDTFSKVYGQEIKTGVSSDDFKWWKTKIKNLDTSIETNVNVDEVKMYKRLRYSLFAGAIESSRSFVRNKKFKQALYCDNLLILFNADQAYWYYRLAKSYARLDKFSQTITNLEKAIALGFSKKDIENTTVFQKFKIKKRFIKLLK